MEFGLKTFNLLDQKNIFLFDKKEQSRIQQESNQYKLIKFQQKLNLCGHTIIKEYRCKQCEDEGHTENLLAFTKGRHDCKIRFCSKPDCVCQRFAEVLDSLESIKRFENLRTLHHFVMGFPKISKYDFENNFDKIKKEQERVMNTFMKKCRNAGVNIEGYRVLDISKGKKKEFVEWDKKYYIHHHFVAIPFKKSDSSINLTKIHMIRKQMLKRQRKKMPFHFQSFGLINKKSLLSYISLRAIGLYKNYEPDTEIYKFYTPRNLRKSIKEGKFLLLNELINEEQYLKYFFQHRHLNKIGDLPTLRYGSTRGDNITFVYCKRHGKLDAHDREVVSVSVEINPDPPPDGISLGRHEIYIVNASKIEKINKETNENQNLYYKKFRPKKEISKIRFEANETIIEYYNVWTAEKFNGTIDKLKILLLKKQIEQDARTIKTTTTYPMQPLPELKDLIVNDLKDMQTILPSGKSVYERKKESERLHRLMNFENKGKIKLSLGDYIDIVIRGKC